MEPVDLLALYRPPVGYRFSRGIILTHDLDWRFVGDHLAPALAGVDATDDRRSLDCRAAFNADETALLILYSPRAKFVSGQVVPWASASPITGRRQHIKASVLRFRRVMSDGTLGEASITRAICGSANLTRAAFRQNREILMWDEISNRATRPFLGNDLLKVMASIGKGDHSHDEQLRTLHEELSQGIERSSDLGTVKDSMSAPGQLLGDSVGPADRVVLISPGFGGASDRSAGELIGSHCSDRTKVEIYTWHSGYLDDVKSGRPGLTWGEATLEALRDTGAAVTLHGVARTDDDLRPLHGKAIIIERQGEKAEVWLGSANCTGPGLLGRNRELMVRQEWSTKTVDSFLAELNEISAEFPGVPEAPTPFLDGGDVPAISLLVRFEIDKSSSPDDSGVTGTWIVESSDPDAVIRYGDQVIRVGRTEGARLDLKVGTASVAMGDLEIQTVIEVDAPGQVDFWTRFTPESKQDAPERSLLRLFGDLDRIPQRQNRSTGPAKRGQRADDRFTIPLSQRSVLLVRYRRAVARQNGAEDLVKTYLGEELHGERKSAHQVVMAVLSAYDPEIDGSSEDDLLSALKGSIVAFDKEASREPPK